MRVLVFVLLAGCSAITDFRKFSVGDGGSQDLAGADLAPRPSRFGEACDTNACEAGPTAPARPLTCLAQAMGRTIPGGMCTIVCVPGGTATCSAFGDAACPAMITGSYCLPPCTASSPCRSGFICCGSDQRPATNGICVLRCP